jgi:hypothetical protein
MIKFFTRFHGVFSAYKLKYLCRVGFDWNRGRVKYKLEEKDPQNEAEYQSAHANPHLNFHTTLVKYLTAHTDMLDYSVSAYN